MKQFTVKIKGDDAHMVTMTSMVEALVQYADLNDLVIYVEVAEGKEQ